MGGFSGRLDFHVVHQLFAAGEPYVRRDDSLMGGQYQHLPFQVVELVGLYVPPLIQIAAVCAREIGGVIDNDRTMTFEKLIYVKVCLRVNRVAQHLRQRGAYQSFAIE